MRGAPVGLLFAALVSACANPEARLERLYDSARQDAWRGALVEALGRTDEGLKAAERNQEWSWKFRLLRAEVLILRRDLAGANALLAQAPPADPRFAAAAARHTYLKAQAQLAQGRLDESMATLTAARRQAESASAADVLLDADILHGQALLRSRKWAEAEALLQGAAVRAAGDRDAYHQAVALHNLGMGRVVRNRFDEALVFFERVLDLKALEPYTVYATALTNAGLSYARLGQFEQATAVQRRAVESHQTRGAPMYLEQALGELGNTWVLQGDAREGLKHLTRAFEVATSARLDADAALWAGNVATAAVAIGDLDRAEQFNRDAIRLKTATKGSTLYNTLNAALIALGRGRAPDAKRLYEEALRASAAEPAAQWEAHAGLAKTALAAGDARAAAGHFDDALRTIQRARSDLLKAEYRLTFLTRVIRFYQDYVDTLVAGGQTDRALAVADSSRAVVLAERMGGNAPAQGVSAAAFVAAAKRSRTVWLAYWLAPARSYAWVVTANGIHFATLPPAAELERLVERHRAAIQSASVDPLTAADSPGGALYSALVAPVAQWIPPGSPVRIVADGALHGINFETLPVAGPPRHYWIEDVAIAVAPSLGLLASSASDGREPERTPASLLLVGDPTPRLREFPKLGYAPIEMAAVSKHFGAAGTARYDGDRASPAGYFSAGPERFDVIHFTAHAAANRTSPLDSAVILSGPAGADKLYARDVAERPLRAALVTISACRSAGERAYTGEGLVGFAWAFMRAGARQVVAGLWDVDDQSTAALMDTLYARINGGDNVPGALRAAKLALMRRGGHVARPYYWAPFQVFTIAP